MTSNITWSGDDQPRHEGCQTKIFSIFTRIQSLNPLSFYESKSAMQKLVQGRLKMVRFSVRVRNG